MLRRWKLPLVIAGAFAMLGGFFYFQAGWEALQYASASYLTDGYIVEIYTQRGAYKKALSVLDAMQIAHPDDPAIYYNAAIIYKRLNDIAAAIAILQAGLPYVKDDALQQQFETLLTELSQ